MSHISEDQFARRVELDLIDWFGSDAVESKKWLDETTCFADFWVDLDVVILAIEVENDADSIRNGVAQAQEYALNDSRAVPVVITPDGHVDKAQATALRNIVPIVEWPAHE